MSGPFTVRVGPGRWVPAETLADAARLVREYIREHLDRRGLGGSAWGQLNAPVRDATGRRVAVVSYNGRVWTPERDWRKQTEIVVAPEGGAR